MAVGLCVCAGVVLLYALIFGLWTTFSRAMAAVLALACWMIAMILTAGRRPGSV